MRVPLVAAVLAVGSAGAAYSQASASAEADLLNALATSADTVDLGPAGIIPLAHGFNASLGTTSQHDSANEWSWLLTPDVAYRINRHFSFDVGTPVYMYVSVYENTGTAAKPFYASVLHRGLFGDTQISARSNWYSHIGGYIGSFSLGMPTGNDAYGLGAGKVTYDINNHFERSFRRLTPEIELGEGDTSTLVDQRIRKDYVSVGPMAHFQAGFGILLLRSINFDAQVYEQLPLAKDLVYSTTGKGKKKVTTSTNVGPAEDNGLLSSVDIPMSPHATFSVFYNRSIRDGEDVAGFSLTFLLRPLRHAE